MNRSGFVVRVVAITVSRLLLNTSKRFVYTFAPALSRFLGVPLTSVTSLIAINQGTSVLGVVIAPMGDRLGYKLLMLAGLTSLTIGMFAAGFIPIYATLVITVMLAGLGKNVFDPAIQAYVGIRVPYERRGMVIGILELAWAGSTVIGIPIAGILIEKTGWQNTFIYFGAASLFCLILILFIVPKDRGLQGEDLQAPRTLAIWKTLLKSRPAVGMMVFFFFIGIANDTIFVVYASWLETSFHLSVVALGIGTSVIGAAEIVGEIATALFSDKLGLKKAVIIGVSMSAASFLILPFMDIDLSWALGGLFLVFVTFEYMIVSALSLTTEIAPAARATMMSCVFASSGIGRVIGALLGGPVWLYGGLPAISFIAALFTILALISLLAGLKQWQSGS